jgi:hypothetical protein
LFSKEKRPVQHVPPARPAVFDLLRHADFAYSKRMLGELIEQVLIDLI